MRQASISSAKEQLEQAGQEYVGKSILDNPALASKISGTTDEDVNLRIRAKATATVDKIDTEKVQNQKILFSYKYNDPSTKAGEAASVMQHAILHGDSVTARAMQEILAKETGAKGVDTLHAVYDSLGDINDATKYDQGVMKSLRGSLVASGVKSKDSSLDRLGIAGGTLSSAVTDPTTHKRLSTQEFLTQTDAAFLETAIGKGISATEAQAILDNKDLEQFLNDEKKKILSGIVSGAGYTPPPRSTAPPPHAL